MNNDIEQILDAEKSIAAMQNARKHMDKVLDRNKRLESTLSSALITIENMKGYIPAKAYSYGGSKSLHDKIDEAIADYRKVLKPQ